MFLNNGDPTKWLMCIFMAALLCVSANDRAHKFYISKTIIEFNPRSQQFEISIKMFTDDVEYMLGQIQGKPVKLGSDNESADADALLEQYLKQHFVCSVDGVGMEWRWVGKEVESDLLYCYLELYRKPDFTTFTLTNDLLVAYFPDQQNIVDLSVMGSTQTLVFDRQRSCQTFNR